MITSVSYANHEQREDATRRATITYVGQCMWRVNTLLVLRGWTSTTRSVGRRSLTSAQSTARQFIATGKHPKP